jgi:hypothetical protein
MRLTWLMSVVEDRLRRGGGEKVRHRDTCFERIKKFLTVYIVITVQQERQNTTAGQEHIKQVNCLWDPILLPAAPDALL